MGLRAVVEPKNARRAFTLPDQVKVGVYKEAGGCVRNGAQQLHFVSCGVFFHERQSVGSLLRQM